MEQALPINNTAIMSVGTPPWYCFIAEPTPQISGLPPGLMSLMGTCAATLLQTDSSMSLLFSPVWTWRFTAASKSIKQWCQAAHLDFGNWTAIPLIHHWTIQGIRLRYYSLFKFCFQQSVRSALSHSLFRMTAMGLMCMSKPYRASCLLV